MDEPFELPDRGWPPIVDTIVDPELKAFLKKWYQGTVDWGAHRAKYQQHGEDWDASVETYEEYQERWFVGIKIVANGKSVTTFETYYNRKFGEKYGAKTSHTTSHFRRRK